MISQALLGIEKMARSDSDATPIGRASSDGVQRVELVS